MNCNSLHMNLSLSNDKEISLLLSKLIPINEIRYKIIALKHTIETNDALEYHIERWETISSKYFKSFERGFHPPIGSGGGRVYSYVAGFVHSSEKYSARKDKYLDFYNETGISYQVRNLLLDILDCPVLHISNILNSSLYEWRQADDKVYGILSKEIMKKFKE